METGLQYSLLRSDYTLGEGAYYIQKKQKLHYLGMPLRISYQWFNVKKWSAYLSTGVILNIPVYGKINERYVTGQQMPYKDSRDLTAPFQWSVGTSVGMQYQFAPNWGVYLEPSLNWYIPNGSSVHTHGRNIHLHLPFLSVSDSLGSDVAVQSFRLLWSLIYRSTKVS